MHEPTADNIVEDIFRIMSCKIKEMSCKIKEGHDAWVQSTKESYQKIICPVCGERVEFVTWPREGFVMCDYLLEKLIEKIPVGDKIAPANGLLFGLALWSQKTYREVLMEQVTRGSPNV